MRARQSNAWSGDPIGGFSVDYQKCFDSVNWGIAFGLAAAMGMPDFLVRLMRHTYTHMERRIRAPFA